MTNETQDATLSEIEQVQQAAATGDPDRDYAFIKVAVASDDFGTYTADLDDGELAQLVESGWSITRAWAVIHIARSTTCHDLTNLVSVKQYIRQHASRPARGA